MTIATSPGDAQQVRGSLGVFNHRGGPTVIMMPMLLASTEEEATAEATAESASGGPAEDSGPAADGTESSEELDGAADQEGQSPEPATEEEQSTGPATEEAQDIPRRRRRRNAQDD